MCAPDRARPLLGVVEAAPGVAFQVAEDAAAQQPRRDVDLDVELAKLGLEARVGDRLQRGGVDQRGIALVVGQVELDLEAERSALGVKARFGQHPGEDVQATRAPCAGSAGGPPG